MDDAAWKEEREGRKRVEREGRRMRKEKDQ